MRSSLVGLLAVEEQALAGLGGPRSDMVGDISNLVGLEAGNGLSINRLGTEPEELLVVEQVPGEGCVNGQSPQERERRVAYLGKLAPWPLCSREPSSMGFTSSFLTSSAGAAGVSAAVLGGSLGGRRGLSGSGSNLGGRLLSSLGLNNGLSSRGSLRGDLNGLLFLGHCECVGEMGIKKEKKKGIGYH